MTPEHLDALLTVARKHGELRGGTFTETSVEVVYGAPTPPPKEKPEAEVLPPGNMPTRQEIEENAKRIREGGR